MEDNYIKLLELFNNYLHTLEYNREYGTLYGDTEDIIEMYEEKIKKYGVKIRKQVY